ncbi:MAG TPA: DUF302 domain-containing protein [Holophagaceae bacterium]|nr:DUF302 domain-containing protein [Holophagaceae bacterium]
MDYTLTIRINLPYAEALVLTREALAAEGFGVPTELDTQAVFKAKLGLDTERRVILGACLPKVAYEALQAEPGIAALLPCNVVVREVVGGTEICAVKPTALLSLSGKLPRSEAEGVEHALQRVLHRLQRSTNP